MVSSESSGILWRALHVIDRSVLPREITFRAGRRRLDLDVEGQCALIGPKLDGLFVVDEQFRQDAPQAYEIVRQGLLNDSGQSPRQDAEASGDARSAASVLTSHRDAFLRLWGRALAGLCDDATEIETTVSAQNRGRGLETETRRLLGFSALELLGAVGPHVSGNPDSLVLAFYSAQRQAAPDSWLFHLAGWPVAFPGEVMDLDRISDMGATARTMQEWRSNLGDIRGPIMSVMMSPQQDAFRCVAMDDAYVALVSRPSAEIGAALAAWRSAQMGKATVQTAL